MSTNRRAKTDSDEIMQWVTFHLENETYGINVMQIQEVLRYTEIAPVPGAPNYVLGIINLRGNVVTVIDTRARFGLPSADVMQVQEVLRYTEIAPVPGAPSYVLGIINLRGSVLTVIDTRARFELNPTQNTENTRIVVIESEKQVVGILVDSVAEVVYLKESEIDDTPSVGNEDNAKFIQGVSNRDGKLLILVDLEQLLSDDEWDALKAF